MTEPKKTDTQPIQPVSLKTDTPPPFRRVEAPPPPPAQYDNDEDMPPPVERRGGCGCWIPALISLFLVGVLALVAVILPPVNLAQRLFGISLFGPNYVQLSSQPTVADNGLALSLASGSPGNFGVALNSVPQNATSTEDQDIAQALAAAPVGLNRQSAVYRLQTSGSAPEALNLVVTIPASANPDLLDMYGWYEKDQQWRFIPSQLSAAGALSLVAQLQRLPDQVALFQAAIVSQPTVLVAYDAVQVLAPEAGSVATIVAPGGMTPTLNGALSGSLAPGYDLNQGYLVMPIIRNYLDPLAIDTNTLTTIMGNRQLRDEHVAQVATFVANNGFDGAFIDYRDLPLELRDSFSAFITDLGNALRTQGLRLGVVVPEAVSADGVWNTGSYDWRALGGAADYLQIELTRNPLDYQPGTSQPVESLLRWAKGEVSRYKILIGLSVQSTREVDTVFTPIGYKAALAALGDVRLDTQTTEAGTIPPGTEIQARLDGFTAASGLDTTVQTPFVDYFDSAGQAVSRMWLTTPDALRFRLERTFALGLAGVAFEDLLMGDLADGITETILNYKVQLPPDQITTELALRWRIEGANGLVGEVITGLNEPFRATIEAPDGNYAINVDVVDNGSASQRGGVAVALYAPTLTPTPIPTMTPTPVPTATAAPVFIPAQPNVVEAPSGAAAAANRPGAGSISVGTFEYGGHVTDTGSQMAAAAMRSAGMTWMKVQLRYNLGMTPDVAQGYISAAKNQGFKILLGIVGSPGELAAGGSSYITSFATFSAGVAVLGPDAIEIWNEPNIDREWPEGQISGSNFAALLRPTAAAIKAANGSVMVISGAPAPTGAEAAFPGRVVNDDRFLREMVAAGGLDNVDCVGAHYNEGIVSPEQTSGDPRDNYYTRYFKTMLDVYWNTTGGARPICWTELGFLTPEGYGSLDPFFGWASNTTVAQQAAWLAQAAALSSQSGRVRLMIVWNVDFSNYGTDPMAGFAMIRPGGGCPACDAMAQAR